MMRLNRTLYVDNESKSLFFLNYQLLQLCSVVPTYSRSIDRWQRLTFRIRPYLRQQIENKLCSEKRRDALTCIFHLVMKLIDFKMGLIRLLHADLLYLIYCMYITNLSCYSKDKTNDAPTHFIYQYFVTRPI